MPDSQRDDGDHDNLLEDDNFVFGVDFSQVDAFRESFDDGDNDNDDETETTDENNDSGTHSSALASATDPSAAQRFAQLVQYRSKDRITSTHDSDIQQLFAWAEAHGAKLQNLECHPDAFGGNGLYMKLDGIATGSMVASLPRSLRIGQNQACRQLGLPQRTPDLSALSLLLVDALTREDALSTYARCLPQDCHNATFMTQEDHTYWKGYGDDYLTNIRRVKDQAQCCFQYIQQCILGNNCDNTIMFNDTIHDDNNNRHDYLITWAIAMVQSRTHSFGSHKYRWMTPIFDFCNHSVTPNCKLEGDAQGNLILQATKWIQKGEEITIDYQVPDDAKLVATYGFSLIHC